MRLFIYGSTVIGTYDDVTAERLLADPNTVRELTEKEITDTFGDYPQWAGPNNTTVDADGNITFSFDEGGWLADLAADARMDRDARISKLDWRYLPGNEAYLTDAWIAYKQTLKDITEQDGFPTDITWPTEPVS